DLETPVSVFLKLNSTGPAFLLESVERGEQVGRYSFIGTNPFLIFNSRNNQVTIQRQNGVSTDVLTTTVTDPLSALSHLLKDYQARPETGLPGFFGGAVGYLAYDTVRFFEHLPPPPEDELDMPDSAFMFTDTLVIFDHVTNKMKVVACVPVKEDPAGNYYEATQKIENVVAALDRPLPTDQLPSYALHNTTTATMKTTSNFTQTEFEAAVKSAKEYILAGDCFQVVLSQRLQRQTVAKPFSIYRALRRLNPSPYMFYLDFNDFQLIGSSPEMFVKLDGRHAEMRPIAGTRHRGKDEAQDEALKAELLSDDKERAEHIMLVDLGRNDLGRVCEFKSVSVPVLMSVERYSHVMHIVSSVTGKLRQGEDAFTLLRACFPAGTVSGAPKIRAMEIINELEPVRRGPYAGAVGYFSFTGNMDTCITIRTIIYKKNRIYLQAGAGIVADSDPTREYQETLNKLEALEKAVELAENGQ
ncbi:MAG: anthranilate synthase component I, partial [Dehalococcoidia bacterium]|nr:anthranilate synthase component I [Dehalococcoidia bacterium]